MFRNDARIQNLRWVTLSAGATGFNLTGQPLSGSPDNSVVYLSFWVQSPRALDNLLIEPNIPKLDFVFESKDAVKLFLNGKSVFAHSTGGGIAVASGLPLQQGWNHFLMKLVHANGDDIFSARLKSSDPAFLDTLHSALQEPDVR
jgi:beta-galactosidase